ncbi:MAG: replicative DNA helicase [Bacteroidetes bacterium]|uniref:Replicative DNA helicase n=1 Tax=Candidatus Cryptobacteroides gallistercoris TaxID=2840765 RepID=A0A940IH06_9BACT|nr:replicative DNA helicase [Candidatus Cryptobacteroides gallistercoris]
MAEERKRRSSRRGDSVNLEMLGLEVGNKPPQALDVEEAVIGSMLIEPNCVDESMEELTPSCFYDEKHRMIFDAISALVNEHSSVDVLTVTQKLKAQGNLETVGGPVALAALSRKVGAAAHVEYYIKILKQKCIQRELITASYDILRKAYDETANVDELIDLSQSKIFAAIQNNVKRDVQEIGSIYNQAISDIERLQDTTGLSGVPSGFPSIDKITFGWQPSDLIILAARPSVGKTAFVLNIARNAAVQYNMPVAFFSLEMPSIQLVKRLMVTESGLSADKIKGGVRLAPHEWKQLEEKCRNLAKSPLYIDDTPSLPVMEFRSKVKRLVKQKGVRLVIVDYLQLMQAPSDNRGMMREQEVAAISRTLKATAKEMNVPIIALSQLSRNAVQRTGGNNRPQLSDLRESGSIEQDADMVIFIHRLDYQGLSENVDDKGKTQIIIAKHRNGEIGDIEMMFRSSEVRFVEMEDTLVSQAFRAVPSRMNDDGAPFDAPVPPPDYGSGMGANNEF